VAHGLREQAKVTDTPPTSALILGVEVHLMAGAVRPAVAPPLDERRLAHGRRLRLCQLEHLPEQLLESRRLT
jgi:hypothetical protein